MNLRPTLLTIDHISSVTCRYRLGFLHGIKSYYTVSKRGVIVSVNRQRRD